jgi:argininosuccinate lyase
LPREVYDAIQPGLGGEVYKILGVKNALAAFRSVGSTAPAEVEKQLAFWKNELK